MQDVTGTRFGDLPGLTDERVGRELAHLRAVYTAAPVGLGFVDTQLKFVAVNDALAAVHGVPAGAHLGRPVRDVLPAAAADEVEPLYRRAIETGQPVAHELRDAAQATAPGADRYWRVTCQAVRDGGGRVLGVGTVVQDVTAQKRAEAELRARARQQAAVAALGNLALTSPDLQTLLDGAACRLAEALDADYAEVLELEPDGGSLRLRAGAGWADGVVGRAAVGAGPRSPAGLAVSANEPIVVPDVGAERRVAVPPLLHDHGVVSGMTTVIPGSPRPYGALGVYTRRRRDFSAGDVDLLRAAAHVLAVAVKDRRSEQALRDGEARMRAVLATLVDGVVSIDERGTIDSVNPAAERLFGYAAAELVGRNVSALMPEPYRREHDRYLADYLTTGRAKVIGVGREVVGRRKDGTTFPMDLAVSELRVGGRRMFTGVVRDVTDRRRLERDILEAGAEEQRRIGRDLHDGLCQHLAGVAFAVEVLRQKLAARGAPEAPGLAKVGELVDQAIAQARGLARGLHPVAPGAGGLASALGELAGRVEGLFHVACLVVCDGPCPVHDDATATHLYRIAQEAVGNAVKHGKARTVVIELAAAGDGLRLSVRDDGVGFAGTAGDTEGMGLRTMAYRARLVGGTLTVRPGERGGTVVACVVRSGSTGGGTTGRERHGQDDP